MKDALLAYVKRVKVLQERLKGNEAATRSSLIGPLFTLLGYDLADPEECVPEFKADFGRARSVKPVDWAFYQNGRPIFLVEAKDAGTKLAGYDEQLGDYFAKETDVKLGVLTNGVAWRFFTDIVNANVMDKEPFVKWDVLKDEQPPYDFLTLLQKSQFKTELVRTFAQRQHQHNLLVNELARLLEPSAEFTRLAIANIETRNLTATVVESWKAVVAGAIGEWAKQRTLASVLNRSPQHSRAATGPCAAESPSRDKKQGNRSGVALADLVAAGFLKAPLKLFREYKGRHVEAELRPDGKIEFEGDAYATCSQAAEAARGRIIGRHMSTNGWAFWQYHDANGENLCLDEARKAWAQAEHGRPAAPAPAGPADQAAS